MLSILFSMFLFSLAGAITPGPVNLMAASVGASAGFARALPHVSGASLSYAAIVWLMGSGLHRVLLAHPHFAHLLPYVGSAYLLYLATRIARAQTELGLSPPPARASGLLQGVLSQCLNPKAWLFAMSGVSLFVADAPDAATLLLVFCSMSGVVCFLSVGAWAVLGQWIRQWLASPVRQRHFNRFMALMLALTVVSMLWAA